VRAGVEVVRAGLRLGEREPEHIARVAAHVDVEWR
jgi:hypothetical protein